MLKGNYVCCTTDMDDANQKDLVTAGAPLLCSTKLVDVLMLD